MALAIGTFILDTQLRRLPGESYAPAAFFINQREMERGVFLSAFMYILFATRVSSSSAWWALGAAVPLSVTSLVVALPPQPSATKADLPPRVAARRRRAQQQPEAARRVGTKLQRLGSPAYP